MKRISCALALAFAATTAAPAAASGIFLDGQSGTFGRIVFDTATGTFTFGTVDSGGAFTPSGAPSGALTVPTSSFGILNVINAGSPGPGGTPVFPNLLGVITGTYQITDITGSGLAQTGDVLEVGAAGSHKLYIDDGTGTFFVADVNFKKIETTTTGHTVEINGGASIDINITNFSYSGSNALLQELFSYGEGILAVNIVTVDGVNLSYLTNPSNPNLIEDFQADIKAGAVPAPAGLLLMGVGSLALGGARALRRRTPAAV